MKKQKKIVIPIAVVAVLALIFSGYFTWNSLNPEKSCGSCHEITSSVNSAKHSAHREISCVECHGTAFSNGVHSIIEKSNMLFTHLTTSKKNSEIHLSEEQTLEVMERCKSCHQIEYADWNSGGHSVTYSKIFLDEEHNKMEPPYVDCFRCHGMFYESDIEDLMSPIDNKGPWELKDKEMTDVFTIPCLSCHEIHSENETRNSLTHDVNSPKDIYYEREERNIPFGFYLRADRIHLRADKLLKMDMYLNGKTIKVSEDFSQRICIQCHSPNYKHEAGTSDDKTPTGVHEGISCRSCHSSHSNDAKNLCGNCHPALSNCGIDVKKMNTTYKRKESPYDIHHVACSDCHSKIK